MGTKDAAGYLKSLSGVIDRVIAVAIPGEENTAEPSFLAAAATDIGISGTIAKDVKSALDMVANQSDINRKQFVLIGGSLYLAGHVLREAGLYPE